MIEVRVPKEIRDYKEKIYFNLSLRQTICVALALGVCVPLYIYGKEHINEEVLGWIIIGIGGLFTGIGFFDYNQLTFEEFVIEWLRMQINPQKRLFKQEDIYSVIRKEILEDGRKNSVRKRQGKTKVRKGQEAKETKIKSSENSTADNTI